MYNKTTMQPSAKIDKSLNIAIFDGPIDLSKSDQAQLTKILTNLKSNMSSSLLSENMKSIEATILQILELPIEEDIKLFLEGWLILYDEMRVIEESIKIL